MQNSEQIITYHHLRILKFYNIFSRKTNATRRRRPPISCLHRAQLKTSHTRMHTHTQPRSRAQLHIKLRQHTVIILIRTTGPLCVRRLRGLRRRLRFDNIFIATHLVRHNTCNGFCCLPAAGCLCAFLCTRPEERPGASALIMI